MAALNGGPWMLNAAVLKGIKTWWLIPAFFVVA